MSVTLHNAGAARECEVDVAYLRDCVAIRVVASTLELRLGHADASKLVNALMAAIHEHKAAMRPKPTLPTPRRDAPPRDARPFALHRKSPKHGAQL